VKLWRAETKNGVATALYENPPMNYFCAEGTAELGELIGSWRSADVRAIVIGGGIPQKFITHYSVEELVAVAEDGPGLRATGTGLTRGYHDLLRNLRDLPKPVIVAMTGDTMGGGFELSLSCDIRIAAKGDFRYGLPEAILGILPGGCGTQRLSRLIGAGRAIDFILRGRICLPKEALELGVVHELADDPLKRAQALAGEMIKLSPVAIAEIKRAVYQGSELHLEGGLEIEDAAFHSTMLSPEALETMREYVAQPFEKRRDWLERHRTLQYPKE
jgi:enoyl-CoA hydratase